MKNRVVIKSSKAGMVVNLDPDCSFSELERAVAEKFEKSARFWGNIQIADFAGKDTECLGGASDCQCDHRALRG